MSLVKKALLTIIFLGIALPVFGQKAGLKSLDFFIGEWDIETSAIQPDGSFARGKAKSIVKYILDGKAIEDVFLGLDANGNINFRGMSIRSYNSRSGKFQIVWIMPGINGITDISAEWNGEKFVSTGNGYDGYGEFLERYEYYDITDSTYSFKMDRSYDGGENWINNFSRIKAVKVNNQD